MIETLIFNSVNWLKIVNPTERDYKTLIDSYGFHSLDIEDCHESLQRPKLDEYENYYFLILHYPKISNKTIDIQEIKIFWGSNYIVTLGDIGDIENKKLEIKTSDHLLYCILLSIIEKTKSTISKVGNEVAGINRDVFNKRAKNIIENISIIRYDIIKLNTTLKPQLRLLYKFENGNIKGFSGSDEMEDYWGDILDLYQKSYDQVEDYGEQVEGLSQTFDSLLTNKTNEIMKVLTFFNTIMLPLSLITGLFGMNVNFPFPMTEITFFIILGILLLVALGTLLYINKKGGN